MILTRCRRNASSLSTYETVPNRNGKNGGCSTSNGQIARSMLCQTVTSPQNRGGAGIDTVPRGGSGTSVVTGEC